MTEYGFLAGLIAAVAIVSVTGTGQKIASVFTDAGTAIAEAGSSAAAPSTPGGGTPAPTPPAGQEEGPAELTNPGFELGSGTDITGWTSLNGSFSIATGAEFADNANAPHGGAQMAFPGQVSMDVLTQTVDLEAFGAAIDSGNNALVLKTWTSSDGWDEIRLGLQFRDAGGSSMGSMAWSPAYVDPYDGGFSQKQFARTIPNGARSVDIALRGDLQGPGSWVQTYFDDVALDVVSAAPTFTGTQVYPLTNPGFESGSGTSIPGWTSMNGRYVIADGTEYSDRANAPHSGSSMVFPDVASFDRLTQIVDVSAHTKTFAHQDSLATVTGWLNTTESDRGRFEFRYLDAAGNQINARNLGPWITINGGWEEHAYSALIPAGTAQIEIGLYSSRLGGGSVLQTYWDDISFEISR